MKQKRNGIAGKRRLASHRYIVPIGIFIAILILLSAGISMGSATTIYVNPGESIQVAIDSLPPEGGVVELAEGTWSISDADSPILINRSNITLRGQGIDKTVIQATEKLDASVIRIFNTKDRAAFDDFWYNYCWIKYATPEDCNITDVTVEDIHIHGASSRLDSLTWNAGLDCGFTKNSTFRNLWIDNFGVGIEPWTAYYMTIENNIIENVSCGLDCPFFHSTLKGNRFGHLTSSGNHNIKLNGGCSHNKIINNIIGPSYSDGLLLYMQSNFNEVINNTVYSNAHCGIRMANSRENIIKGNIVYSNGVNGISTSGSAGNDWIGNVITGNIIYENEGYGIKLNREVGILLGGEEKIIGNTVYSNSLDGIYTKNPTTIKNNIIVNNGEYGINHVEANLDLSYNDVWNNKIGNYNGVSAGTGDISEDPLFVDPINGDFHLKSIGGHWTPSGWLMDSEDSPCVDAGVPHEEDPVWGDYSNEPTPNGDRINMGAYGNTGEASKSPGGATGTISGTVKDKDTGTPIEGATVTDGTRFAITNESGGYIIPNIPEGNYTVTASAYGYENSSKPANVTANNTTIVNFELNPVGDIFPPTTTYNITPTPNEAGWNNDTPVVVTFFRNDADGSGVSHTNYSKISETGPWTTVDISAAMGPDAGNVTDISESGFNVNVSDEGVTKIWYYSVDNNSNVETAKSINIKIDTKPPVIYDVSSSGITSSSATITWTTDELADSLVKYGTSQGIYTHTESDSSYTQSHSISLTSLTPNTTYYYVVNSTDEAGNSAQSTEHSFKTSAISNIVYVATDGTGDYNCDGTDDHVEINQAISYINSIGGGTVHLRTGTYIINDVINLSSNITFEGDNETSTIIKLKDQNNRANWGLIAGTGISNTTIQNFTLDGNRAGQTGLNVNSDVDGTRVYNSNNVTFQFVTIKNHYTDGFEFSKSIDCTVKSCKALNGSHDGLMILKCQRMTLSNNYVHASSTGNAGARIYGCSNSIVENNIFDVYGFGILINPQMGGTVGNNIYRYNYLKGNYGDTPAIAVYAYDTAIENETILGNIIARSIYHGIRLYTSNEPGSQISNVKIINNIIRDSKSGIILEGITAKISNITAKNNIIANNREYGIYGNVISSYNDVWNNSLENYGAGASVGTGDISQDPLFADPADGDFHLKSQAGRWNGTAWVNDAVTSPCIDAGDPVDDYSNEPEPDGGRINMGAYGNTIEASKSLSASGTISGTVKDTSNNPIQGATVIAASYSTTTNSTGQYSLLNLPAGTYTVTASKTGYQTSSQSNVVVNKGATTTVNFTLQDNFPPYTSGHSPAKNATNVPGNTSIIVHAKDDGLGVNQSSIIMTVEGTKVTPAITGTKNDYTITYTPPAPFNHSQVVDVTIDAKDLASPPNVMPQDGYSFTIKSAPDTTPPAAVTNLATSNQTSNSITLSWTAPGDDGDTGTASQYDIRYSTSLISEANWNSATQCTGEPIPKPAGSTETFTVTGLSPNTTYYFALKTADEVPNWSEISNCVSAKTTEETNLIAEWHFDKGTGEIAVDSSRNRNNGTLVNNPTWINGKIGKALQFDGSSNYVEIPNSNTLNSITSQITIIAWVKTDFSQRGTIVDNWFYDKTVEPKIGKRSYVCTAESGADAGKFDFGLSPHGDGSEAVWLTSNNPVTPAQWTHVAFVSNATNMSIYINGNLDAITSAPSQIHVSHRPIHIAAWNAKEVGYPPFGDFFKGVIDEVKIYNKALSAEEIRADYEAGLEDTKPPASISNLQNTTGTTWINWTWTNPSDDDFSHTMIFLNGTWKVNTSLGYYNATNLAPDTSYTIGTRTVDTAGNINTSWVNQTARTKVAPDTTPPAAVNDLAASNPTSNSITLTWTAPGDDGNTGTASQYDIRYSTSAITESNWNSATPCTGEPSPKPVGSTETFMVTGLSPNTTYYFALKTADEVPNWANISNSPDGKTLSEPETIILNDTVEDTGWSESYWTEDGLWHITERRSNSTSHSWWYGQEATGNYDTGSANSGSLVSQEIDLSDATNATLTYWTYWATETHPNYDLKLVEVSVNGSAWTELEKLSRSESGTRTVSLPVGDKIKIRFRFDTVDHLYNKYEGWFIDDIKIESAPPAPDTIPPGSISNLQNTPGTTWINWTWRNPSDGDFNYTMIFLNGTWKVNTSLSYYTATNLAPDTSYTIGTRTVDTASNINTSWVNQTARTKVAPDTTPPAVVNDLAASNPTSNSIALTWTAPGDDGNTGTASQYDIRYSTSLITESNWNSATQCTGVPAPKAAGSSESFTVTSLYPNTTYYFALKTADEVPNWSPISNSPSGKTTQVVGELVGYWKFDEGNGTIVVDSSGKGNNGTLINDPVWIDGKLGKALNFDGNDDCIEIPSSPSLNSITSQITVIAWVKTDFAQRGTIVDNWFYDKTVTPQIGERAYVCTAESGADAGKFDFGLSPEGNGSGAVWLTSNTTVTPAHWTHVAFVSNATNMSLYVNGSLDSIKSAPSTIHLSHRPVHIGAWNAKEVGYPPFGDFFKGVIDEVKIYNRALTPDEIRADYSAWFYSQTRENNCDSKGCTNTVTFNCSGSECNPSSDATLTIYLKGDYDYLSEYARIYVDGNYIGDVGGFGMDGICGYDHCKSYGSKTFTISKSSLETYLSDGSLTVKFADSSGVNYCCNAAHKAELVFG